jgi:hypothetical protein
LVEKVDYYELQNGEQIKEGGSDTQYKSNQIGGRFFK